ncbi:hypothetical protein [Fibrella forsythiae]|uniref:Uncharacterized protein n=1 Tax=Fibrella forsythiae TaxID=2817061 RepID=A0ABS3JCU9_9BACT|nr:hypothetical protein [Fibrella forsythiae]MBO0947266.1 hypothetical protein [Fibrella forsythiae]
MNVQLNKQIVYSKKTRTYPSFEQVIVSGRIRGNDYELQAARTARQSKQLGRG